MVQFVAQLIWFCAKTRTFLKNNCILKEKYEIIFVILRYIVTKNKSVWH